MDVYTKSHDSSFSVVKAFVVLCLCFSGICLAGFWLGYPGRSRSNPPGYRDFLQSATWDREAISNFLNARIPEEVLNLSIEGSLGVLGSYGTIPTLTFSFIASPHVAETFAQHFCGGVLYTGFDPLYSMDTSVPTSTSVLVRGLGTIHYSQSLGTPATVYGNRCPRLGTSISSYPAWLEEIILDKSNPTEYKFSYNLPITPNSSSAEEFYPHAEIISPLGDRFRLYVTGFNTADSDYILSYPTICMETARMVQSQDHFAFDSSIMDAYVNARVEIYVNSIPQRPAKISEVGLFLLPSENGIVDKWQYCLTKDWEPGTHTMKLIVTPPTGESANFEWTFVVPD
ncbi:MAG TPA: hypothetical protein PLQ56_06210 [Aggregatilineales bacterium]|nr:hypothetical protein [Aggregatilineales bacterium]